MNAISAIFINPAEVRDQRMVDLLESMVSSELVQQIRDARSADRARQLVGELWKKMEDDPDAAYGAEVEDWLQIVMVTRGHEEMAGFHFPQSEAGAGVDPSSMPKIR